MIKTHRWTAKSGHEFAQPGEHILCAFIIGPDRDDPKSTDRTLHIRANQDAIDALKQYPLASRIQLAEGASLLLHELIRLVLE